MLSTIEYLSLLRKYMRENAVKYGVYLVWEYLAQ